MRGRATGLALPALLVLALVAVVVIAATGSTPESGGGTGRPPSEALFDAIFSIGLFAVVVGGILLVYGLMQRKAIAREVASGRYRRISLVGFLAFFALFTALTYWRLSRWEQPQPEEAEQELAGEAKLPTLPPEAETSYEPSVSWPTVAVVIGLVLASAVAYVLSERRAQRGRRSDDELANELAVVLDETLDDLRAETDPRRAIIAAYARLERVLAANGVPRRSSETADEYLQRVLLDLELQPEAVERLTALFTRAKFSHHDVDAAMKAEAIGALEHVRDELRAAGDAAALAPPPAAPVGGAA